MPRPTDTSHTLQELYLYAFATQAEILHHLRSDATAQEQARLEDIMKIWQRVQIRVTELLEREAGEAERIMIEPIPDEHHDWVANLTRDTLFQKTFQNLPVSFSLVEIDRVVAPQRTVDLTYVSGLRKKYHNQMPTFPALLDICLGPKTSLDPIQYARTTGNTHVFSSPHTDVRFLGSYRRPLALDDFKYAETGGLPTEAIVSFVGYGLSPINMFQAGDRYVLNNGFHRVYVLRSLGVRKIPAVIQHVRNVELEFPRSVLGLPREYVLNKSRPVLVKDFFEPGFAIELTVQKRLKMLRVSVGARHYEVPL